MMEDQSVKYDGGKYKPSKCHPKLIEAVARISEYGESKYPCNSWRKVEVHRYFDAALRHLIACFDDLYAKDAESGLKHLWHAGWNIGAILELEPVEVDEAEARMAYEFVNKYKGFWEEGDAVDSE